MLNVYIVFQFHPIITVICYYASYYLINCTHDVCEYVLSGCSFSASASASAVVSGFSSSCTSARRLLVLS